MRFSKRTGFVLFIIQVLSTISQQKQCRLNQETTDQQFSNCLSQLESETQLGVEITEIQITQQQIEILSLAMYNITNLTQLYVQIEFLNDINLGVFWETLTYKEDLQILELDFHNWNADSQNSCELPHMNSENFYRSMYILKLKMGYCHKNMNYLLTNTTTIKFVDLVQNLQEFQLDIGFHQSINSSTFALFNENSQYRIMNLVFKEYDDNNKQYQEDHWGTIFEPIFGNSIKNNNIENIHIQLQSFSPDLIHAFNPGVITLPNAQYIYLNFSGNSLQIPFYLNLNSPQSITIRNMEYRLNEYKFFDTGSRVIQETSQEDRKYFDIQNGRQIENLDIQITDSILEKFDQVFMLDNIKYGNNLLISLEFNSISSEYYSNNACNNEFLIKLRKIIQFLPNLQELKFIDEQDFGNLINLCGEKLNGIFPFQTLSYFEIQYQYSPTLAGTSDENICIYNINNFSDNQISDFKFVFTDNNSCQIEECSQTNTVQNCQNCIEIQQCIYYSCYYDKCLECSSGYGITQDGKKCLSCDDECQSCDNGICTPSVQCIQGYVDDFYGDESCICSNFNQLYTHPVSESQYCLNGNYMNTSLCCVDQECLDFDGIIKKDNICQCDTNYYISINDIYQCIRCSEYQIQNNCKYCTSQVNEQGKPIVWDTNIENDEKCIDGSLNNQNKQEKANTKQKYLIIIIILVSVLVIFSIFGFIFYRKYKLQRLNQYQEKQHKQSELIQDKIDLENDNFKQDIQKSIPQNAITQNENIQDDQKLLNYEIQTLRKSQQQKSQKLPNDQIKQQNNLQEQFLNEMKTQKRNSYIIQATSQYQQFESKQFQQNNFNLNISSLKETQDQQKLQNINDNEQQSEDEDQQTKKRKLNKIKQDIQLENQNKNNQQQISLLETVEPVRKDIQMSKVLFQNSLVIFDEDDNESNSSQSQTQVQEQEKSISDILDNQQQEENQVKQNEHNQQNGKNNSNNILLKGVHMKPAQNIQKDILEQYKPSQQYNGDGRSIKLLKDLRSIETFRQDYTFQKFIGQGAQGTVSEYKSNFNREIYAVKTFTIMEEDKVFSRDFQNEIKIYDKIKNNEKFVMQVLEVYGGIEEDKYGYETYIYCMVMERAQCNLQTYIYRYNREQKQIPYYKLKNIIIQSATGLEYLQSINIAHRDIKPQNILLTEEEEIRITDFGISKQLDNNLYITKNKQRMDTEGAGTLIYMSPELRKKFTSYEEDNKFLLNYELSDIYSLGLTLLQVVRQLNPIQFFELGINTDPSGNKLQQQLDMLDNYPQIQKLLSKMLQFQPSDRANLANIAIMINEL